MRCRVCSKQALINLRRHNIKLCKICFVKFFKKQVKNTIHKYKLFKDNEKIAVAVSGGKDSITLLYVLNLLQLKLVAYFIDLGIPEYSEKSRSVVEDFCDKLDIRLYIEELSSYGKTLPQILKNTKRASCSICGSIKRYLMNKFAFENNYVIATGHHLDDLLAGIFSNLANSSIVGLSKLVPKLEYSKEHKLACKIKPFYRTTVDEIELFHKLNNLPKTTAVCKYAKDASSTKLKEWLLELDKYVPNMRLIFILILPQSCCPN